jgi:hypothetical protein
MAALLFHCGKVKIFLSIITYVMFCDLGGKIDVERAIQKGTENVMVTA